MDINRPDLAKYKKEIPASKLLHRELDHSKETHQQVISLKNGQILKGEVLDIRYNEVKIRLYPGEQVITARLDGNVDITINQTTSFQVLEEQPDLLILKLLPEEVKPNQNSMIDKALKASGLPLTDKNRAIVSLLLKYRMPIDKQTLQLLVQQSHKIKNSDIDTLVLMHKHQLPITAGNVKQFEAYQNGEHKLLEQINDLVEALVRQPDSSNENQAEAATLHRTLLDMLLTDKELHGEAIRDIQLNMESVTGTSENIDTARTDSTNQNANKIIPKETTAFLEQNIRDNEHLVMSATAEQDVLSEHFTKEELQLIKHFTKEEQQLFKHIMKHFDGSDGLTASSQNRLKLSETDWFNLTGLLKKLTPIPTDFRAEYQELLKEAFHRKYTLSPKLTEASVKKLYQDLLEDMEKIDKISEALRSLQNKEPLLEASRKLQDNLQFIKDLNQVFHYLPLPLNFKGQEAHGDLYVFTRKKSASDNEGGIRVLLHLDMPNLGRTDINITLTKAVLQARFYLEEESTYRLIENHMPSLSEALKAKGYDLHAQCINAIHPFDFKNDFIEQDMHEDALISRYNFDVRM